MRPHRASYSELDSVVHIHFIIIRINIASDVLDVDDDGDDGDDDATCCMEHIFSNSVIFYDFSIFSVAPFNIYSFPQNERCVIQVIAGTRHTAIVPSMHGRSAISLPIFFYPSFCGERKQQHRSIHTVPTTEYEWDGEEKRKVEEKIM